MKSVNIITELQYSDALSKLISGDLVTDYCHFCVNSSEDKVWDYVVVFESLSEKCNFKCRKGGLVYITGEPDSIKKYYDQFLNQFDVIITSQKSIKQKVNRLVIVEQILPPLFGYNILKKDYHWSYEDMRRFPYPNKMKDISVIVSNKMMTKGHFIRYNLVSSLMKEFPNKIDFWGSGVGNPSVDKADAILPYKFHICIENSMNDYYWTEKIMDPYIGYSIPIYAGCPNIEKYFPMQSYYSIDVFNLNSVKSTIANILSKSDVFYKDRFPYLLMAREKLLSTYSFTKRISDIICKIDVLIKTRDVMVYNIKPENCFMNFRFHNFLWNVKQMIGYGKK